MSEMYAVFSVSLNGTETPPPFGSMNTNLTREQVQDLFLLSILEGARPCRFEGSTGVYRLGSLVLRPLPPASVFFPS